MMMTGVTLRPAMAMTFEGRKKSAPVQEIPIKTGNSWMENGVGPNAPTIRWVTEKAEIRRLVDAMPQPAIAIYPPPPPMDITNTVALLVTARSTSGAQYLSAPKVTVDAAKKQVSMTVNQNVSEGGVSMRVMEAKCFVLLDKANLPKNFKSHQLAVTVNRV